MLSARLAVCTTLFPFNIFFPKCSSLYGVQYVLARSVSVFLWLCTGVRSVKVTYALARLFACSTRCCIRSVIIWDWVISLL